MTRETISLGDLALSKGGSVDPQKHPEEVFELYSIPAFDAGAPEVATGSAIGSSKKLVQAGDVLISRIVPHIRRAWVVGPSDGNRQIASSEWIIFRDERIWPNYLRRVLVEDSFHAAFMRTVSGVGGSLLRARPALVFNIRVPFPALAEQKRIAGILDVADALRAKRRESLAQVETLLQSVFLDMFGDPVINPREWPVLDFSRCLEDLTRRATKVLKSRYSTEGQWQIIDQSQSDVAGYTDTGPAFDSPLPVVVFGDHTRCVKLVKRPFVLGADGAKVLSPKPILDAVFLRHLLPLMNLPNLGYARHMKELKRLRFPVPPLEQQRRFASVVECADKKKSAQSAHLQELDILFASLQSRAFRGGL